VTTEGLRSLQRLQGTQRRHRLEHRRRQGRNEQPRIFSSTSPGPPSHKANSVGMVWFPTVSSPAAAQAPGDQRRALGPCHQGAMPPRRCHRQRDVTGRSAFRFGGPRMRGEVDPHG
jgi:hypothetical protein